VARFSPPFELTPRQPTLVKPFHRPGWVYEEKVDGWRIVAYKAGGNVRLISRKSVEHTARLAWSSDIAPDLGETLRFIDDTRRASER
jgi:ATP-dependent DNA ligase